MFRQANKQAKSPMGQWLLDYVAKNAVTKQPPLSLTELSRLAGLSDGTLRSLIYYPERLPSLETCIRLAKVTGYSASTFLQLAGIVEAPGINTLDPQRVDLLRLYDHLSPQLQRMLVMIAEAHIKYNWPEPPGNLG